MNTEAETITQNEASMKLASPVSERVEIEGIRQTEGQFELKEFGRIRSPQVDLSVKGTTTYQQGQLRVLVQFSLRAKEQDEQNHTDKLFSISAHYVLIYRLKSSEGLNDENYDAFGRLNGLFNAWPYWREFVQATTSRMGIPAITVPVLHVLGKKQDVESTASKQQH